MARDEAIKILSRLWGGDPQQDLANRYVNAFVALGILKLDEPKSFPQKFRDFVGDARLSQGDMMRRLEGVRCALEDAGLKIVEK